MILSDRDIRAAMTMSEDPLIVHPPFHPDRLQPASLELTLDLVIQEEVLGPDGYRVGWRPQELPTEGRAMKAGQFILASSIETVRIPTNMVALVNGKSSWAREGLVIHQTAGLLDPGFHGTVTLELSIVGNGLLWLKYGMPVGQLVFIPMTSPAERPYGSAGLGSHYQGQRGATPSAYATRG